MYLGFSNVSIRYGKKEIIDRVNIEFAKGKTSTIIGSNGCGKTSLLKTISYAVKPYHGHVLLDGKPIRKYSPKQLAKRIAYLPQVHYSPSDIDIRTLVSYGRYPYQRFGKGLSKEDNEMIDQTIELTGLSAMENRVLDTLSGGERQRAWIAMTLCQQPEILILDEPITYLDIGHQVEIMELIKDIGQNLNITIVMVLHDINLASRYSDYLFAIKDKKIYAYGSPREIITPSTMGDVFRIDTQIYEDEKNRCPFMIVEKRKSDTVNTFSAPGS